MGWMVLYGSVLLAYFILLLLSGREGKRNPLKGMAAWLYKRLEKGGLLQKKRVEKELNLLYPGIRNADRVRDYYIDKIALALLLVLIGDLAAIACFISGRFGGLLSEGRYIYRNPSGAGEVEAHLEAEIGREEDRSGAKTATESFQIVIGERKYDRETLKKLAAELSELLPGIMLGENILQEEVRSSLNLVSGVEGYPFRISWESSNYGLVSSDGAVVNGEVEEAGETVCLTATVSCDDYTEDHSYYIRVCPPLYSDEERLQMKIAGELQTLEEESRCEDRLTLPETVDGLPVRWKEKTGDDSRLILLFLCAAAALAYAVKDSRLHEKLEEREKQMLLDYPGLVSKLTLYMGAGMTIRNAFRRIADSYQAEKKETGRFRYAYEEMLLSCHELSSGISEGAVYENFAKRCRLPPYTRLGNLLSQNLKKGSNSLTAALRKEAKEAFTERKNTARKLGEEAGTKLLLPMMLMLGVVMVLIMIPAYYSFSF